MRLWIDTEFNEFRGDLISLALVDEDGREFYEVVGCAFPGPWVAEHVMPILGKLPNHGDYAISRAMLSRSLHRFLRDYQSAHVVADWPEDIAHFCGALIIGPGIRIDTPPLTLEVRRDLDAVSAIPHNALEDAKAMRLVHLAIEAAL